jgi:hypothetical protein
MCEKKIVIRDEDFKNCSEQWPKRWEQCKESEITLKNSRLPISAALEITF